MSRSLTRQERWRATVKKTHGEVMQNAAFSRIFLVSTKQKIFWTVLSPVILSFCFRDIQPNGFGVQSLKEEQVVLLILTRMFYLCMGLFR